MDPLSLFLAQKLTLLKSSDPHVKLHSVLMSFLVFTLAFILTSVVSSPYRNFKILTPTYQVLWCQRIVRMLFGTLTSPITLWYLFLYSNLKDDVVHRHSLVTEILLGALVGFCLYEVACLAAALILFKDKKFYVVVEPAVTLGTAALLICQQSLHYYGCIAILVEGIRSVHALSSLMKQVRLHRSLRWRYVLHVAIHLYHYCPLLGLYCYYLMWSQLESPLSLPPVSLPMVLWVFVELFAVAPYWSHRLTDELSTHYSDIVICPSCPEFPDETPETFAEMLRRKVSLFQPPQTEEECEN